MALAPNLPPRTPWRFRSAAGFGRLSGWAAVIALSAFTPLGQPALAFTCTADSQCAYPGMERRYTCQGSVLVSHERRCLGGRCVNTPETRIDCGGGVGLGNCDPSSGRCRRGPLPIGEDTDDYAPHSMCPPRCICNGKTLIIVTGRKATEKGKRCETEETECKQACACKPEPRCVDSPKRKR